MRSSRPSSSSSRHRKNGDGQIDKLDYHPGGRPLLPHDDGQEAQPRASQETSYAGSFFEHVAEGVVDKDKARLGQEMVRYMSFVWAVISCLCAGSISAYSLYAPLFQTRLRYSQLQVNGVSITAELALYLPVPLFGVLCDRYGPGQTSLLAGILFGIGYILAAFTYRSGPESAVGGDGWPYAIMILAFIPIGMGTSCMYLSAVTTCAKNFGRGKFKGLALAVPIASFGLSGMWQSQLGTNVLYEPLPDGAKGPVDVFRYFIFLACLTAIVGVIGFFTLRIVGEDEYIDEAINELERSGLLTESEFYRRGNDTGYGAISTDDEDDLTKSQLLQKDEERRKKTWLLNEETRLFLGDRTMWLLAAGFFMVTGPGEAFINNLGTIIETLYVPSEVPPGGIPTSATAHISVVALTSTVSRLLTGTLTDVLAPTVAEHQHRRGPNSLANSLASLGHYSHSQPRRFELSRIVFLIIFSVLCSIGQVVLATGLIQNHAERFWIVSASIGAGYGAIFSLTPIIISVVWGVDNFATNWGIVATVPAISATIWGLIYSTVYQQSASNGTQLIEVSDALCYGVQCYAPTFWAMAVSVWIACGLWIFAWRGPDGWVRRSIAV